MFFDRYEGGENAVLVHLEFTDEKDREDSREFQELVHSAGVNAVDFVTVSRHEPSPRYLIGIGKVEELAETVRVSQADVVLFNHALSPSQERNLEKVLGCRVIDRTGLILDIFAQRARTHEGKLQVELAQLQHLSTRLVRGWTHLERQKGGIGLRGPGETQLETDRRLLRGRIKSISARLEKVRKQRNQGRKARRKVQLPTVSLVGYTNAGKSTLFNKMTDAEVYAADQLFATLDPTLRRLLLPDIGPVVLADTVGFIRHLPHKLVEAFRATLEETTDADLLLHIIDAYDPERRDNIEQVEMVLAEIDAHEIPCLQVYNKIDLLPGREPGIDYNDKGQPVRVWLSAVTGAGIELLHQAIAERLGNDLVRCELNLGYQQGKLRARLYESGGVVKEWYDDEGQTRLEVSMPRADLDRIFSQEGVDSEALISG
ncbi:ribosome rescue GTPase HflX [Endozoicomonadaceae bacterium StTr2]